jgi:hypothetical protein
MNKTGSPVCSICYLELASIACICCQDILLIGNHCLSAHLSARNTSHNFMELSLAFRILSGQLLIEPYLACTNSADSNSKSIYVPRSFGYIMHKYEPAKQKLTQINIIERKRHLSKLRVCESDTGFYVCDNIESSHRYLYAIVNKRLIKLAELCHRIEYLAFYYHDMNIYSLRKTLNPSVSLVERLNLNTNRWEKLTDIRHYNESISILFYEAKIYFVIECYSVVQVWNSSKSKLIAIEIENSNIVDSSGIVSILQEKVYMITRDYIQIYDLSFRKLHEIKNPVPFINLRRYNIVAMNDSIYFYAEILGYVKYNTKLYFIQRKKHSLEHYASNISRYIFHPLPNSYWCVIYDLKRGNVSVVNISKAISDKFVVTSVCVMPSGCVLLQNCSKCSIMNPASLEITQLPDLPINSKSVTLVYCNQEIYALSKDNSKKLLKYSLEDETWYEIGEMVKERIVPACLTIDTKIYIIGGGKNSIEIYDTQTNSHRIYPMKFNTKHCVAMRIEESIWILNGKNFKILSRDLEILKEGHNNHYFGDTYTSGNIGRYGDIIYFHNEFMGWVESMHIINLTRGVECFSMY